MRNSFKYTLVAGALLLGAGISGVSFAFAEDDTVTPDNAANPDYMAVKAQVDNGDYNAALTRLSALEKETPNDPDILNLIGFSLRKTGHPDQALNYYNPRAGAEPRASRRQRIPRRALPRDETAGESRGASRSAAEGLRRLRGI